MTFTDWRKTHRLTQAEVAAMLGVHRNTVTAAEASGRISGPWEAFARLAAGELPTVRFTTDQTSYNQPVVLVGDDPTAYGPADVIRRDGRIAAHVVALWALDPERSEADYQAARKFLRYWPTGPQLR